MKDWSLAEKHGTTREVLTIYATVSWLIATSEPVSACRLSGQAARNASANANNKRKSGRRSIISQSEMSWANSTLVSFRTSGFLISSVHCWRVKQSPPCHHRKYFFPLPAHTPHPPYFLWLKLHGNSSLWATDMGICLHGCHIHHAG